MKIDFKVRQRTVFLDLSLEVRQRNGGLVDKEYITQPTAWWAEMSDLSQINVLEPHRTTFIGHVTVTYPMKGPMRLGNVAPVIKM